MKNNRLAILFLMMIAIGSLAGCRYSDTYLVNHPTTFQGVLHQCQLMGNAAVSDTTCQQTISLYQVYYHYSRNLAQNPAAFGASVLNDQMKQNEIKAQIDQLKLHSSLTESEKQQLSSLQQTYNAITRRIAIKLGVIKEMEPI